MRKIIFMLLLTVTGLTACNIQRGNILPSENSEVDVNDINIYRNFIWEADEMLRSLFDNSFSQRVIGKSLEPSGGMIDIVEYYGPNHTMSEVRGIMDHYYSYNVLISELHNLYFAIVNDEIGLIAADGENLYYLEDLPGYTSEFTINSITQDIAIISVTRFGTEMDQTIFEYKFDIRDPVNIKIVDISNEHYVTDIETIPLDDDAKYS